MGIEELAIFEMSDDRRFVTLRSPDDQHHIVSVGSAIKRGTIKKINTDSVELEIITPDGMGGWDRSKKLLTNRFNERQPNNTLWL